MVLRPQPRFPEPDTGPFWEATKNKELKFQVCDDCEEIIFYPRAHCTSCGSLNNTWYSSKGFGEVYTYSVVMQSRHPAFKDLGPYAVSYVDLEEGFRILTNIVNISDPIKDIYCGMKVKIYWLDQEEENIALPMFEPV